MDLQNIKVWVGGMDEVWNRKYEPGPIRGGDRFDLIDLCELSAPGEHGITELASDLNSLTTISEWSIWSSGGTPAKTRFCLARAAQCARDSR